MGYIGNQPAETPIVEILETDIKIGEDDQTKIDFETANEIHLYANNTEQVYVADNIFGPQSDSDVDLGTTGVRWKDAFVDSVTSTGAITGTTIDATTDFTIGDTVITDGVITDTSGLQIASAVDLVANTLTSTGSLQVRTIDYSDGDLAMTIADGGGVTFAQNAVFSGTIDIGHATDTTLSGSSGVLSVQGTPVKTAGVENMWVPATAMTPRDNAGCASIDTVAAGTNGRPDFHVLDFDKDSDEHAQFSIAMPKSWDGGNINAYFYWIGIAATSGVAWATQVLALNDNEEIDAAYGTAVVVQDDSQGDATELLISAKSGDIACSGADGDLLYFQVFRDVSDGNDDMNGDARLVGILFEYTTNAATDA